jgi:hypothetical protein
VAKVVPGESQALILFLFLWVWLPHVMYVCARVVCVLRGGRRASGDTYLCGAVAGCTDRACMYVCDRWDGEPQPPHACREFSRHATALPRMSVCLFPEGSGPGGRVAIAKND